jgi:hypothetical protein
MLGLDETQVGVHGTLSRSRVSHILRATSVTSTEAAASSLPSSDPSIQIVPSPDCAHQQIVSSTDSLIFHTPPLISSTLAHLELLLITVTVTSSSASAARSWRPNVQSRTLEDPRQIQQVG